MEAKELRIGNLVLLPCEGHEDELVSINKYDFEEPYNFKPIPLTEEILLKAGFEKKNDDFKKEAEQRSVIVYEYDTEFYYYTMLIKYVHQLQNLYFALTGEELKIEL